MPKEQILKDFIDWWIDYDEDKNHVDDIGSYYDDRE